MKPCPLGLATTSQHLARQLKALRKHARAAKRGEAKGIHGMRVASRRIRAIVEELSAYLKPSWRKDAGREARKITHALGQARELDVAKSILAKFDPGEVDSAAATLQAARAEAQAECDGCIKRVLKSPLWRIDVGDVLRPIKKGAPCLRSRASKRLKEQMSETHTTYARWRKSKKDEDLHALRIQFKKLRYTCEAYEPIYGPSMRSVIAGAEQLQEDVGAWNDVRMAVKHLRAVPSKKKGKQMVSKLVSSQRTLHAHVVKSAAAYFSEAADSRAPWGKPVEPCCRKNS